MEGKTSRSLFIFSCLASFLNFSVQLSVSKVITPIFGGTSWVWILTLLFFQSTLLIGYFIAGYVIRNNPTQKLLRFLGFFLLISSLLMGGSSLIISNTITSYGYAGVLLALFILVGMPAIAISSCTIILQRSAYNEKISPWQLYFYSNIGSISALIIYPTIIENYISTTQFLSVWRLALILLSLGILKVSFSHRSKNETVEIGEEVQEKLGFKLILKWLIFSAAASMCLSITSSLVTQDVASIPLLWALPLATFLLAFSLPFAPKPLLTNIVGYLINCGLMVLFYLLMTRKYVPGIQMSTLLHNLVLFFNVWVCVSGLVKSKPDPDKLQYFYTMIALGGLIGTILVSIVSPLVFDSYMERYLIIPIAFLLPLLIEDRIRFFNDEHWYKIRWSIVFVAIIITSTACIQEFKVDNSKEGTTNNPIHRSRSMYGVITVKEARENDKMLRRTLIHGNTLHGKQDMTDNKLDNTKPTTYYSLNSPLGLIYDTILEKQKDAEVLVIGLGAGTINYYSKPVIKTTFFEIDEKMVKIAKEYFSYLELNAHKTKVEVGDGRILLEGKQDGGYSLIIVDAFSSDSIPQHLITNEAIELYFKKLKEDGILCIHTSNRYVNIEKIVKVILDNKKYHSYIFDSPADADGHTSVWVIGSKKPVQSVEKRPELINVETEGLTERMWTDAYSPVFPYLK